MTARLSLTIAAALTCACSSVDTHEPDQWPDPTAATLEADELEPDLGDGASPEPTLLDMGGGDGDGDPSQGPGVCQAASDPTRFALVDSPAECIAPDVWICFEGEFRQQPAATVCCAVGQPWSCHMLAPAQACPMGEWAVCEV